MSRPLFEKIEHEEKDRLAWLRMLTAERLKLRNADAVAVQTLLFKINSAANRPDDSWQGSVKLLAQWMGKSTRTIHRYIAMSEQLGLLLVHRTAGFRNRFKLDWDGIFEAASRAAPAASVDWSSVKKQRDETPRTGGDMGCEGPVTDLRNLASGGVTNSAGGCDIRIRDPAQNCAPGTIENHYEPSPPPDGSWGEVAAELRNLGVVEWEQPIRAARSSGCEPDFVLHLIEVYRSRRGANGPGALVRRISRLVPGEDLTSRWPAPLGQDADSELFETMRSECAARGLPTDRVAISKLVEQEKKLRQKYGA